MHMIIRLSRWVRILGSSLLMFGAVSGTQISRVQPHDFFQCNDAFFFATFYYVRFLLTFVPNLPTQIRQYVIPLQSFIPGRLLDKGPTTHCLVHQNQFAHRWMREETYI